MSAKVCQCKHLCSCSTGWLHLLLWTANASFTVMDTICASRRHCGAAPAHRWIFEQSSFKVDSCDGFRRPEAWGMLPELAMRAERILISDSLGLDSVCRQLRSSSMSHPNCLGLAGLPNAAYKERVDDLPTLEVGCCDCHSRSAIFCVWLSSWDPGGLSAHRKVGKVSISCGCQNQTGFGENRSFLLLGGKG